MTLLVEEVQFKISVLVLKHIVNSIDVVIGLDAIDKLGGVAINWNHIQFSRAQCAATLQPQVSELIGLKVQDKDFCVEFDNEKMDS